MISITHGFEVQFEQSENGSLRIANFPGRNASFFLKGIHDCLEVRLLVLEGNKIEIF